MYNIHTCLYRHRPSFWHVHVSDKLLNFEDDGKKLIKEYRLAPNDSLIFCERVRGGSTLQPPEGHVLLTKEPCCVSYDDDPIEWRVKLECGHVVGE